MDILSIGTGKPDSSAKWWNTSTRTELLQSEGHSIDTITYFDPSKHPGSKNSNDKPIPGAELIHSSIYLTPLHHFKKALFRRSEEYDLIYGNNYLATTAASSEKINQTPIIFHVHGDIYQEYLLKRDYGNGDGSHSKTLDLKLFLNKLLGGINYRTAEHIACVSKTMVDYVADEYNVNKDRISYVPNYTNIDYFKSVLASRPRKVPNFRDPSKLTFGYIGGFQAWQGVENLLAAAKEVDSDDANFIFVGKEGESSGNIGRIGRVNRATVRDYYAYCDVLVLPRPSHVATEIAAPTKFAEYTAMGKPVLSTNVGDAANLIEQYNCGIVVEDNSVDSVITGINKIVNMSNSDLSKMGENSRILAENEFSLNEKGHLLVDMVEKFE